jgi:predicted kinase
VLGCHVVVTGTAGAGKSTLAAALAEALGVVLLSKDRLKETIHQALPADGTAGSLRLSAAAMDVLYDIAALSPGGTVLDANWRPDVDCQRLAALLLPLLRVFCNVPPRIAQQRLVDRVESGERHPVHRDAMDPDLLQRMVDDAAEPGRPLPLAGPVVYVDTSHRVDIDVVASEVEACVAGLRAPPSVGPSDASP